MEDTPFPWPVVAHQIGHRTEEPPHRFVLANSGVETIKIGRFLVACRGCGHICGEHKCQCCYTTKPKCIECAPRCVGAVLDSQVSRSQ